MATQNRHARIVCLFKVISFLASIWRRELVRFRSAEPPQDLPVRVGRCLCMCCRGFNSGSKHPGGQDLIFIRLISVEAAHQQ